MKFGSLRKAIFSSVLLGLLATAGVAQDDQSTKQDMKDAAHSTGQATKNTGHKVKRGTKKAAHKTAHGAKKTAQKAEDKTQ